MKYLVSIFSLVLLISQSIAQTQWHTNSTTWSNPLSDSGLEYLNIPTCMTSGFNVNMFYLAERSEQWGWIGWKCEYKSSANDKSPTTNCLNGGILWNQPYTLCKCASGFYGKYCEAKVADLLPTSTKSRSG